MTVIKVTMIGPHVHGGPFGLGCQSCSGREILRESLHGAGRYAKVRREDGSPDLFLPLSAFWKISISAEDLCDNLRGQMACLRLCLHSNGLVKVKGALVTRYSKLPSQCISQLFITVTEIHREMTLRGEKAHWC